jgi:hypothetical protein
LSRLQTIALTGNRPKTISGYATSPPKPSDSFPRQPPESQRQRTTIFARCAAGLDAEGAGTCGEDQLFELHQVALRSASF